MSASKGEKLLPMTVNVSETDRRLILERVAEQTIRLGRPVSVSEVAREMLRTAAAVRAIA